jgi:glycosyltransferase involved in cell wall biosynthesis
VTDQPLISIITPVYDPSEDVLEECLDSVTRQTWTNWEHILVDDASPSPHVARRLLLAARADERLVLAPRQTNGGIVAASNDALTRARGQFLVLLDHDDLLEPNALEQIAAAFASAEDVDYVYTDEDVMIPSGRLADPFYKPDWSPERFRNQMYTCHISAFRASLVEQVGGFREGYEGSQDWDLVLRVTEQARRIVHIPEVLYHWRVVPSSVLSGEDVKPYAYESARRALESHAERVGIDAEVVEQTPRGYFHLVRRHSETPLVSIIIPTRCSSGLIWGAERSMVLEAVRSIVEKATWPNYEIVLVVDEPADDKVLEEIAELVGDRLVVVPFKKAFNFSEKCNLGVLAAAGEILLFLNDDVQVIDGNFIEVLVGFVREPDVGAASLRLLFEDGRVQHAGHVYLGGNPGHLMFGQMPNSDRNRLALSLDREVAGVTAACMAIRAEVFESVGGFSMVFAGNYNDVDLCLKLRREGYRIIVSAQATLYHFESITRDPTVGEGELQALRQRWSTELSSDPYYNPNFDQRFDNYPHPVMYPRRY